MAADIEVLMRRAAADGLRLGIDGDRLAVSGPEDVRARWRPALVERKAEVLAVLRDRHATWSVHFPDLDPLTVVFAPPVEHAEVLRIYPAAVAAVPMPEPVAVPLPADLLALVNACMAADLLVDDDIEALGRGFAVDPVGTRELIEAMHAEVPTCRHCAHYRRPGLSAGYCIERDDLPPAYALLRELPGDGGAGCKVFVPAS